MSLVRQGRNDEAIEAYRQSLRLRPDASLQRIVSQMSGGAVDRSGSRSLANRGIPPPSRDCFE